MAALLLFPFPRRFIFILIGVSAFQCIKAQDSLHLQRAVLSILNQGVHWDTAKVPGIVVGVIDHDSTWVLGFGRVSKESDVKPDAETVFELGGASKIITAYLINAAIESGFFNLDSVVNSYLPDDQKTPFGAKTTILQLLTHTSGLPKIPEGLGSDGTDGAQPYENYTYEDFYAYLKNISAAPAPKYLYSHLGYVLLGSLWETNKEKLSAYLPGNTGKERFKAAWEKIAPFLKTKDWQPCQGYDPLGNPAECWKISTPFLYSLGMKGTINQWLDFLKYFNLSSDISYISLEKPLFPTNVDKNTWVSKAWHVVKEKNNNLICIQSGLSAGHSAFVAFNRSTKTGVVVLANGKTNMNRFGYLLLESLNNGWRRKS